MAPFNPRFDAGERPDYEPPSIVTMTERELLEELGPAVAYTGNLPFGF